MNLQSRRTLNISKIFQVFFYALFVVLWFKGNFPLLRTIPVTPAVPFAGLAITTAIRAFLKFRSSPVKLKFKFNKDWGIIALILLLSTAVHIPFLVHNYGLMDSDEAIPALQGKHIAEGKLPTIFYYSARFQGSLPQHYYALLFKVFGYSIFLVKLAAYLAFAAFLIIQFLLLKNIFSREFAAVVSLFYVFPFHNLILSSFDVGSGFAVVFLLGSLIFTLTYKIYDQGKDHLLQTLGFLMGLAFWTHQISIVFILTSAVFLLLRYKLRVKRYLTLALFFAVGLLPVLISEIYWNFPLIRWLFGGESAGVLSRAKMTRAAKLLLELFSSGPAFANAVYLIVLFLGIIVLIFQSVKKAGFRISGLFAVYFLAFIAVYLLSDFSNLEIIRYLYILYVALPVLFAAAFLWVKPKALRYALTGLLFVLTFFGSSAKASYAYFQSVKERHRDIKAVTAAMAATGEHYWKGHYWISYLINAVSKERFNVASTTVERYYYYALMYDTEGIHTNRVFLRDTPQQDRQAQEFVDMLGRLGKKFGTQTIGQWFLVYGINGYVFQKNIFFPPDDVPNVMLDRVEAARSCLVFLFAAKNPLLTGGFRLHVEIPGYCSSFAPIGPGERFLIRIPYPPERRVHLKYFLDFQGLYLDPTLREVDYDLPAAPAALNREAVELLAGFGPRESFSGKKWPSLEREVRFQVNKSLGETSKITLELFSPFYFSADPFWHGDFVQEADIFVNDQFDKKARLGDGHNSLTIDCRFPPFKNGANIITLKFKYAIVLSIEKDHWKTAAYLEGLKID